MYDFVPQDTHISKYSMKPIYFKIFSSPGSCRLFYFQIFFKQASRVAHLWGMFNLQNRVRSDGDSTGLTKHAKLRTSRSHQEAESKLAVEPLALTSPASESSRSGPQNVSRHNVAIETRTARSAKTRSPDLDLYSRHRGLPGDRIESNRIAGPWVGALQVPTCSGRLDGHLQCFVTGSRPTWV